MIGGRWEERGVRKTRAKGGREGEDKREDRNWGVHRTVWSPLDEAHLGQLLLAGLLGEVRLPGARWGGGGWEGPTTTSRGNTLPSPGGAMGQVG